MKGYIQQYQVSLDSNTNEVIAEAYDKSLCEESVFDGKPHIVISNAPQIDSRELYDLQIIKKLLDEMGANYHIILSPLYAQTPFHPTDTVILHQLFPQRVHDYSHRTDITTDGRNYYEKSHYNTRIGAFILSEIYPPGRAVIYDGVVRAIKQTYMYHRVGRAIDRNTIHHDTKNNSTHLTRSRLQHSHCRDKTPET